MITADSIVQTWGRTFRFIVILMVAFFAILFIIWRLSDNIRYNIDYTNDKTLITIIDKKNVAANSVLPSCDCWSNTGIEIRPGEEYEIKVSGKIHTTADKMIKDAERDIKPRFSWIGPEGDDFRIRSVNRYMMSDSLRRTLLLSQDAKMGQVLFYFQKKNSKKPNCEPGLKFYNPDSIFVYEREKGLSGKNETNETWYVWATVNDMLIRSFDRNEELAYIGGAQNDSLLMKQKNWVNLKKQNYNRIWFDDNFGNFVVSAKILKQKHFLDY